ARPRAAQGAPVTATRYRVAQRTEADRNFRVIVRIAHVAIDQLGLEAAIGDLAERIKCECARTQIRYSGDLVTRAITSALTQRRLRRCGKGPGAVRLG